MFSLYSPGDSYDEKFLSNYISINLKPAILRIQGVGDMMIMGGDYRMRIWIKPDVIAQYKLIPSDVTQVLPLNRILNRLPVHSEKTLMKLINIQ